MAGWKQRMVETARRNRVEVVEARLTRRDLVKLGLVTTAGFLVTKLGLSARAAAAGRQVPESPATTPWVEPLPIPEVARPAELAAFTTSPTRDAQMIADEAPREPHQHWTRFDPAAADLHVLESRVTGVRWHRELPPDECWCWNGAFPGPRIHARSGRPTLIRFRNQLPTLDLHRGYGRPVLAPHVQGAHVGGESDGDPVFGLAPGRWRDWLCFHRSPGALEASGEAEVAAARPAQSLSYHDIFHGAATQNTYRGLTGIQLAFDRFDSGDETDPDPLAWRLPSGPYDVPLVLHDRSFDAQGRGYFDLFDLDGLVGDKVTVNGRIQPFLPVARRRYRFRFFNAGPARSYTLHLSNDQEMVLVAEDGAMLPAPRRMRELSLAVGRSAEVVLDFRPHPAGTQLFVLDMTARQPGGLPTDRGLPLDQGAKFLRFDVDGSLGAPEDPSQVPERFFEPQAIDLTTAAATRTFVLERDAGGWTVNGRPFDPAFMAATPQAGTSELWAFVNRTGVALPALELHPGLHDVVARGAGPVPAPVRTRGSILSLAPGETVHVWRRFADFTGTYAVRSRHAAQADQGLLFLWRVVA